MSNDLQHIAHSCLRTTDRVIDALINTAFRSSLFGADKFRSDFASRLAYTRCAVAVFDARCTWIRRCCIWSARRDDRCATNILGRRHPLSAISTKIAELLGLSSGVHPLDPAAPFPPLAIAAVSPLPTL